MKSLIRFALFLTFGYGGTIAEAETTSPSSPPLSFKHDVRPILSNHCFACHGPDENHREADVRLDIADEVDLDEVLARINSDDPDEVMPPPGMNKPLAPDQVATLKQWMDDGAAYEKHWAFVPPSGDEVPAIKDADGSDQAIDRFVLAKLESLDREPKGRADKRTLVRRVTLDLTGLPPSLEEVHAFLNDASDQAYENLVDRLMNQPAYGEHMARYWLDLVRFADTNGLHHDHYREMTPYRDWVIRSFNDNLPMDQFITYQLAGDLFDSPSIDQQIASGFNRLHLIIDRGTALPEESDFRNVVDQVSAVSTAFMGLTMQCAICHDHKFDPITMKDFYQLSAFFNNFDGDPETGWRGSTDFTRGLQPPYLNLPTPEQKEKLAKFEGELTLWDVNIQAMQARLDSASSQLLKMDADEKADEKASGGTSGKKEEAKNENPGNEILEGILQDVDRKLAEQSKASLDQAVTSLAAERDQRKQLRDQLLNEIPATLVMKERSTIRPAHIMTRGAYDQPGEEVQRNTPGFLPPMKGDSPQKTRMDLANWLTDASNPLTARVTVNRFWQQFFGVGLVRTSEDFGSQGESPSHPELLDHLAVRLVESGWDVKDTIRSIVLSRTYQQSSQAPRDEYLNDPSNALLSRGARFRLDAEVLRDQMLSVGGLMNSQMYGKSVKPPQPEGLWKIVSMPNSYPREFTADLGDQIYRRSIYTFWKRGLPPPQMTIFDAPSRESCIARRERTNTPLQALLLMNEEQNFSAAMHFANSLLEQPRQTDVQRMATAYESITSQALPSETLASLMQGIQGFRQLYRSNAEAAERMIAAKKSLDFDTVSEPQDRIELASWTMLVHSLLNLDITKTHE